MDSTQGGAPISITSLDVYKAGQATALHAPAPLLLGGVQVYGRRLRHTAFSASVPALAEAVIVVQLNGGLSATVSCGEVHRFATVPGDVMVLPSQERLHTAVSVERMAENQLVALPPHFLAQTAERDLDADARRARLRLHLAEQRDPLLYEIGCTLERQLQSGIYDQLYLESLLTTLAVHVLRNYAVDKPRVLCAGQELPPPVVRRVCDYVEAHLDCELSLEELGRVANYSPYYLAHLFHSATGQTLHHYVMARRLARAKTLLETTDLPLHTVASLSGFKDQGQFSKLFHRVYGYPPSANR